MLASIIDLCGTLIAVFSYSWTVHVLRVVEHTHLAHFDLCHSVLGLIIRGRVLALEVVGLNYFVNFIKKGFFMGDVGAG